MGHEVVKSSPKVIVIGAGIGGLALAASLRKLGIEVHVYERAKKLRQVGAALSIMPNALSALAALGVELNVADRSVVFEKLHFLTKDGKPIRTINFGVHAREIGQPCLAIHRASLQDALLELIDQKNLHLDAAATGYVRNGNGVVAHFANGQEVEADILVGADGFNSAVRTTLAGASTPAQWNYIIWRATPEFTHPTVSRAFAAHYWGRGQRFAIVDIGKGRVYWWGTKNMPAGQARNWSGGKAALHRIYDGWSEEIHAVLDATHEPEITSLPAQDRPFLDTWGVGPVTLIGDAAHPMLTSLGQGACIAIEDAAVLAHCIKSVPDTYAALRRYEESRRERKKAIFEASRNLSRIEQLESPMQVAARNAYFRFAPESIFRKQNEETLHFPGLN